MSDNSKTYSEDVDHLLRNAELRDELEPYFDESIHSLNVERMPTQMENEFLASMLAWERAPVLPIADWFEPALQLPHPDSLNDSTLRQQLRVAIEMLFSKRIVLDFTDHLSDRQLYCLIFRDILPSPEKKLEQSDNFLHWDCAGAGGDPETYLRYYASEEERQSWEDETGMELPPAERPPFARQLPRGPL